MRVSVIVTVLAIVIATLTVIHAGVQICWKTQSCGPATSPINQFGYLFDLNSEASFPNWFSTVQLFAVAVCLGFQAAIERVRGAASLAWWGLAAIFVVLSFDEAVDLHGLLRDITGSPIIPGTKSMWFNWVVQGSVIFVAVAAVYVRWVLALPSKTRNFFILAGAVYTFGALGLEMVGGIVVDDTFLNATYLYVSTAEEVMEMTGILIMLYAVLQHLGQYVVAFHIRTDMAKDFSVQKMPDAIAALLPREPLSR